jgi:hypothetical protein
MKTRLSQTNKPTFQAWKVGLPVTVLTALILGGTIAISIASLFMLFLIKQLSTLS